MCACKPRNIVLVQGEGINLMAPKTNTAIVTSASQLTGEPFVLWKHTHTQLETEQTHFLLAMLCKENLSVVPLSCPFTICWVYFVCLLAFVFSHIAV